MELLTTQNITATKLGVILEKSGRAFEELGVLNPAIYINQINHYTIRIVRTSRIGQLCCISDRNCHF